MTALLPQRERIKTCWPREELEIKRGSCSGKWDHGLDYCHHCQLQTYSENPLDENHWIKCGEADVIKPTGEADRMIYIYTVDLMVYLVILDITRIGNTQKFLFPMKLRLFS